MARGERRSDEEKLKIVQSDLAMFRERRNSLDVKIQETEKEEQELIDNIQRKKLVGLINALEKTGMSVDDAIKLVEENPNINVEQSQAS